MSIKFLVLGGSILGFGGGAECRFYFYGRADFPDSRKQVVILVKLKPFLCVLPRFSVDWMVLVKCLFVRRGLFGLQARRVPA